MTSALVWTSSHREGAEAQWRAARRPCRWIAARARRQLRKALTLPWRLLGYAPGTPRNDQPTVTALLEYPRLECRGVDFAARLGFSRCDRNAGRPCSRSVDVNDRRISSSDLQFRPKLEDPSFKIFPDGVPANGHGLVSRVLTRPRSSICLAMHDATDRENFAV